jgi:hypothetical protein
MATGRRKISMSTHLQGIDMGFRFKYWKKWGRGQEVCIPKYAHFDSPSQNVVWLITISVLVLQGGLKKSSLLKRTIYSHKMVAPACRGWGFYHEFICL